MGYRLEDGVYRALLLNVTGMMEPPQRLRALFEDSSYTFTGRAIANDVGHVGKDFNMTATMTNFKHVDLGPLARAREVVTRGTAGLEKLVSLCSTSR